MKHYQTVEGNKVNDLESMESRATRKKLKMSSWKKGGHNLGIGLSNCQIHKICPSRASRREEKQIERKKR